jgi:hypothetical protein
VSKDWAEVEALLHRLAPVWVEVRTVLNEAEPGARAPEAPDRQS